uniref:Cleavage/polyadenylation specificity factor A subunit N-terminal domain-containing protein n=1 Tax=Tarenaya spinosa TaxID=228870 RepID=Q1KUW0_9ROSI|nr:hypothetical protein [Tarenaya spinosa]
MAVVVRSSKLSLPNASLSPSSPRVSSLLFEPISSSLALSLSDSSISLYPSLFPFSSSSLSYPQTLIPAPCSSTSFLLLRSRDSNPGEGSGNRSSARVLFVVAGPYRGGSRVLLRFYALREEDKGFVRAQVVCDQKGMEFDRKVGVLLNLSHGVSVKVTGSVNYFAMHSVSNSKILIFGVKLMSDGNGDEAVVVKLMRCGVVECSRPVWSIGIFSGMLLLGEDNGVRVLNLREIVKGSVKKVKNSGRLEDKRLRGHNVDRRSVSGNGYLDGKKERHAVHASQRLSKHRQESSEASMCFVSFQKKVADMDVNLESKSCPVMSVKAISIQALSSKRFLILDSAGYIHVLHVSGHPLGSNFACNMQQLPHFMEVQMLAVLPEITAGKSVLEARVLAFSNGYDIAMDTIWNVTI